MTVPAFVALLCEHREGAKDGPSFVLSDMVPGQRLIPSVKANYGIGLDVDNGFSSEQLDAALASLGCLAVRYTTHSHMKTVSDFAKSRILKFAQGRDITDRVLRDFVLEEKGWAPAIAETIHFVGFEQPDQMVVARCEHSPMPKNRVIIPLLAPYVIKDSALAPDAARKWWMKIPAALAAKLGIPIDRTCAEQARLFFFPRHT